MIVRTWTFDLNTSFELLASDQKARRKLIELCGQSIRTCLWGCDPELQRLTVAQILASWIMQILHYAIAITTVMWIGSKQVASVRKSAAVTIQ